MISSLLSYFSFILFFHLSVNILEISFVSCWGDKAKGLWGFQTPIQNYEVRDSVPNVTFWGKIAFLSIIITEYTKLKNSIIPLCRLFPQLRNKNANIMEVFEESTKCISNPKFKNVKSNNTVVEDELEREVVLSLSSSSWLI